VNKQLQTLLFIGAGVAAFAWFARNRITSFNEGTPFEGSGVVGALGNVTNEASGGVLAELGSDIGLFFSDIFDRRTLDDF